VHVERERERGREGGGERGRGEGERERGRFCWKNFRIGGLRATPVTDPGPATNPGDRPNLCRKPQPTQSKTKPLHKPEGRVPSV
jgi:hypothetical protein